MASTPRPSKTSNGNRTPIQIRTPAQQALENNPNSKTKRLLRTPLDRSVTRDLLNSVRRGNAASGGGRRAAGNAPTPHAAAARRALHSRRTAIFTPGKGRRRSLREQRETPLGLLRNLGRVLAPATQPLHSSSSSPGNVEDNRSSRAPSMTPVTERYEEDDEDELTIDRPRLSLPFDDDEADDEVELKPPRMSIIDDENFTVQSVELPRRAIPEMASRLSRGSLGSVEENDFFRNEVLTQRLDDRSDFFPGFLEDLQARAGDRADETLQRVDEETRRLSQGRESDFGLQMPEGLDEPTTFLFDDPQQNTEDEPLRAGSSIADIDLTGRSGLRFEELDPATFNELSSPAGIPFSNADFVTRQTDPTPFIAEASRGPKQRGALQALKKQKRISEHGIPYPALPTSFVKRVASVAMQTSGLSNHRISPDTLVALTQASEWFFEQLGGDLAAYANHAKRKTIEEADVATLMRRQRQVSSNATIFSLAQKHLPRELLQELRMPVPPPKKKQRKANT